MPALSASLSAALGVSFAVAGSFASAVGLSFIRKAHNLKTAAGSSTFSGQAKMLVVVGNLLLTLCSSSFDLVAMLFAPIELVSPLAGTTLILNIFVAPLVVNEKVYAIDVTAAAVMVPGLVVAVMFGPTGETPMTTALMEERMGLTPWVLFELATATLIGAAAILVRVSSPSVARDDESRCASSTILRRLRPFLYPTLAAAVGGQQLVITKLALMLLDTTAQGDNQFLNPSTYVIVVFAIGLALLQVYLVNAALRVADALTVVPAYQALLILFSITTSATFFGTFSGYEPLELGLFVAGVVLVVFGVILLSQRPEAIPQAPDAAMTPSHKDADADTDADTAHSSSVDELESGTDAAGPTLARTESHGEPNKARSAPIAAMSITQPLPADAQRAAVAGAADNFV